MSEELRERSFEIPTAEGLPASNEEGGENPLKMVLDRMHGRWTWAIVLGCVLGAVLSIIGYKVGPVTYQSTAILAVEARMEAVVLRKEDCLPWHKRMPKDGMVPFA